MLPDFPELKVELLQKLSHRAKTIAQSEPGMADVPATQLHEGRTILMVREDGSSDTITFDVATSAEATLHVDEMRQKGPLASIEAIDRIGEQLQHKLATRFYEKVREAAESVGNTIDAKGTPVTPEKILQMLDMMEPAFDEDGSWFPPRFIFPTELAATAEAARRAIDEDPNYRAQRDAIINRQREEWRVREASRRLVD